MWTRRDLYVGGLTLCLAALSVVGYLALGDLQAASGSSQVPAFQVDSTWPKPLPNHWLLGSVIGVAIDSRDHVWIVHRPKSLQPNEIRAAWKSAPPVLEFDQQGNLVQSWGGPGTGYEWPQSEHGIYVDFKDNVWLGAGGQKDAQVLKFTRGGKFLLQIGHQGKNGGSNDTQNLGGAANMVVDPSTNEVYVADGYVNHRVIVFDADTGAYKRHWGAYGKKPDDDYFKRLAAASGRKGPAKGGVENEGGATGYDPKGPPPEQFRIVHAVRIAKDGLVYVCDRTNDRIQVFHKDGSFVKEMFISKNTVGSGSVWDIGFSIDPSQKFMFNPDGTDEVVWELLRDSLQVQAAFGGGGHWAGEFYGAHSLAVDSKGNLFITETYDGKRVQKFVYKGIAPGSMPSFASE
jgi:hypothetical protein